MRKETAVKEQSEYEKALIEMYEMGKEHGYELAKKDMELERLRKEVEKLEVKSAKNA